MAEILMDDDTRFSFFSLKERADDTREMLRELGSR